MLLLFSRSLKITSIADIVANLEESAGSSDDVTGKLVEALGRLAVEVRATAGYT